MKLTFRSQVAGVIALLALMGPAVIGILIAPVIQAQMAANPPTAPPVAFEFTSVTVHPMTPGTFLIKDFPHAPPFVTPTSNTFRDTLHVQDLIMEAYGVREYQILYLPGWTFAQRGTVYDVEGKAMGGKVPTPEQMQQMLQALLAERFHLKAHWETKPKYSIYSLVVDKNAPKFKEFRRDDSKADPTHTGQEFNGTTVFALARFLSQNLDYPVIDGTGLPAVRYDFDIDSLVNYHEVDREEGSDPLQAQQYLRTAVQHQLGLRLDLRKESTQFLAIDHIEEPPQAPR